MPSSEPVKKMKCPVCGKRACDVRKLAKGTVEVMLKCPHCKNLVTIKLAEDQPSVYAEA